MLYFVLLSRLCVVFCFVESGVYFVLLSRLCVVFCFAERVCVLFC